MFTVVVATLSVNIAANVVSPANDFANLAPKHISLQDGRHRTGIVGILMMPWKLIADPSGYIFKWLLGYSGGLGSIAGVLVCDYWFVRHKRLVLADLYRPDGSYPRVSPAAARRDGRRVPARVDRARRSAAAADVRLRVVRGRARLGPDVLDLEALR